MLKVLIKEPGREPFIKEIENKLESFQQIVGGYIEVVRILHNYFLVCNEEGKIQQLPPNFSIGDDVIVGTCFLVKDGEEGEFESLTNDDIIFLKLNLFRGS